MKSKYFSLTDTQKVLGILFFAFCFSIVPNRIYAQAIQKGFMVVTCVPDASGVTLGTKDIRQLGTLYNTPANRGKDMSANVPTQMMWKTSDFGGATILSTTINQTNGTIYAGTGNAYTWPPVSGNFPSKIYKIDPVSGAVSLFATLTGNRGVGYIDLDATHSQLFAVDMSEGKIARINSSGTIIDHYDPMTTTNTKNSEGYPVFAERILGVAYNAMENRIYYSTWGQDGTLLGNASTIANTIRSVSLTATGAFDATTDRLEITMPKFATFNWSNPVADIEFNASGNKVLLAEGIGLHSNRFLQFDKSGATWTLNGSQTKYDIGNHDLQASGPGQPQTAGIAQNARGGAAWGYQEITAGVITGDELFAIATGDGLKFTDTELIYGIQMMPVSTGADAPNSILVDLDANTQSQDKGVYADLDIYKGPPGPISVVVQGTGQVCAGGTISLYASAADTYSWAGPNGFTANTQSISIPNATNAAEGAYSVTVGSAIGGTASTTFSVTVSGSATTFLGCTPCNTDGITIFSIKDFNVDYNGKQKYSVRVTGANTVLNAWIDWNQDGDVNDIGEQVLTNYVSNTEGYKTFWADIPFNAVSSGDTYTKNKLFRVSISTTIGDPAEEVEEMLFNLPPFGIVTGRVFIDTNCNGIYDNGEKPIPNTLVYGAGVFFTDLEGIFRAAVTSDGTMILVNLTATPSYGVSNNSFTTSEIDKSLPASFGVINNVGDFGFCPLPNTVTYCNGLSDDKQRQSWTEDFRFPKFNPALGTLNSVFVVPNTTSVKHDKYSSIDGRKGNFDISLTKTTEQYMYSL
jgi:hypothetical protein